MPKTLKEMIEARGEMLSELRGLSLSESFADEKERFDELMSKQSVLGEQIERAKAVEGIQNDLEVVSPLEDAAPATFNREGSQTPNQPKPVERIKLNWRRGLDRKDNVDIHADEFELGKNKVPGELVSTDAYRKAFQAYVTENSATQAMRRFEDTLLAEGVKRNAAQFAEQEWLQTPIQFVNEIIRCCDDMTFIRQLCRVFTVTGSNALGFRKRTKKNESAAWGCKCTIPNCDTPEGENRTLEPQILTACTRVCRELFRRSSVANTESFLAQELARSASELMERGYFYGTGTGQPLGLFTDTTVTDVSMSGGITYANLVALVNTLPLCYLQRGNLAWVVNKDVWTALQQLVDGNGRPLWQPANDGIAGSPARPTLLGYPVYVSAFVVDGIGVGDKPILFGDFSQYYIADYANQGVERDVYIDSDEVGWYLRMYTDGQLICNDAMLRGEIAA